MPTLRQKNSSTIVWAMMPKVAVPPRSATIAGSQAATSLTSDPKTTMNIPKPAIETMLFTIGAHA